MKIVLTIATLLTFSCLSCSVAQEANKEKVEVKWYTWEEAIEANKTVKKNFFIDVYTDWCGWCKVMDKKTFSKAKVANFLNQNYYPIKLNAEMREVIVFQNHSFKYIKSGRRGIHELAYSLLDGKMSYPSVVYLNEKYERILISPGYKKHKEMMKELKFVTEEKYKTMTWKDYERGK